MIQITRTLAIDEGEIRYRFVRASGPGGQHVNKAATAVQLRFDVRLSHSLPDDVRRRLMHLAGRRVSRDGVLTIDARRFRSQERNRQDAINRLVGLIARAAEKPTRRRPSRPSLASKKRRVDTKRRRGQTKRLRHSVAGFES